MRCQNTITVLMLAATGIAAAWAQQKKPEIQSGATLKIEGQITQLDLSAAPGPPTLTVKTAEGKEYTVHIGPLADLKRQGFNPKVGDKVTVTGALCCEMQSKTMIHSSEIVLAGKTFRTSNPMSMPTQGMGPMSQGGGMGTPSQDGMAMPGAQGTGMGPGMGMGMQGGCCSQQGGMGAGAGMGTSGGCCAQGGASTPKPSTESPSR